MNGNRPLVACAACGQPHPGHVSAQPGPHYCSIACYRAGTGLDDSHTGDGRQWCQSCQRYIQANGHARFCSEACRVADWRRRQPPRPPSPTRSRRVANIKAVSIADVIAEHAPARYIGSDSGAIVDDAVVCLATVRGLQAVGDAGARLHALASLAAQIDALLPAAVVDARDQDYSWSEIAALLGVSRDRTQRLAALDDPTRRVPPDD